jgi:hypothetical protein
MKMDRFLLLTFFVFIFSMGVVFGGCALCVNAASLSVSGGRVIRVPEDYSTIAYAVGNVSEGDTIVIGNGVYRESGIVVDKSVRIVGVDRNGVIVDGGGVSGSILIISSGGVTLENLTLRNTDLQTEGASAVSLNDVDGVVVKNVLLLSVAVGVHVRDSNYSFIMYCDFSSISVSGIKISGVSCNNTLVGNTFKDLPNKAVTIASSYSQFTRLYHNNFFNSSVPSPPATTFFDNGYPSGGNFWSDHVRVDLKHGPAQDMDGGDGIVDVGYPIDSPWDNYPLMFPVIKLDVLSEWGSFEVLASSNASLFSWSLSVSGKFLELVFEGVDGGGVSCRVWIPKGMLSCSSLNDWVVMCDGENLSFLVEEDDAFSYFHFVFSRSAPCVVRVVGTWVVPEFLFFAVLFLIVVFSFLGVMIKFVFAF